MFICTCFRGVFPQLRRRVVTSVVVIATGKWKPGGWCPSHVSHERNSVSAAAGRSVTHQRDLCTQSTHIRQNTTEKSPSSSSSSNIWPTSLHTSRVRTSSAGQRWTRSICTDTFHQFTVHENYQSKKTPSCSNTCQEDEGRGTDDLQPTSQFRPIRQNHKSWLLRSITVVKRPKVCGHPTGDALALKS